MSAMTPTTRRRFLGASSGTALMTWVAPALRAGASPPSVGNGGERVLGTVPFVGEGAFPLDTTIGAGLGKRRALDLSTLSCDALLTAQDRFFIRTGRPDRLPPTDSWKVRVHGLVQRPVEVPVEQLKGQAGSTGRHPLAG